MRLKNQVAIITGAGSGIGQAIALNFVKEGAKVVIADWSEENGKKTQKQIEKLGGQAAFIKTDVSQAADVMEMTKLCLTKFKRVDILVNNAGIVKFGSLHETPEEDWDAVLNVNLKSVFLCSKSVLPAMLKQKRGKIINIASIAGLVGFDKVGPYCASKGGIIALTKEMAVEYAAQKINVNCIAPGIIKTAMTKDMLADPASRKPLEESTLYPRLGEPADIALAAVYLASGEADFVNGEILVIDGGWIAK